MSGMLRCTSGICVPHCLRLTCYSHNLELLISADRDHTRFFMMEIVYEFKHPTIYIDIVLSFLIANSVTVNNPSRSEMEHDLRPFRTCCNS